MTDTDGLARGNAIHHNGQLGMGGHGTGGLIEGNEIAYNLTMGYAAMWEGGGAKWAVTTGLTIRGNWSHDNAGPGLWTDINNIDTLYEDNRVEDSEFAGIFHEISYAAIIRNNVIRNNGSYCQKLWTRFFEKLRRRTPRQAGPRCPGRSLLVVVRR